MKKLALVMFMALAVMMLALPAAAATVQLSATNDAGATGTGGWWVKNDNITVTATEDGLQATCTDAEGYGRLIWAYPDSAQANIPYFNYTLTGTPMKVMISRNQSAADAVVVDLDDEYAEAGTHSIDTTTLGADLPTNGYYYVSFDIAAGQPITLTGTISDTAAGTDTPTTGTDTPTTGDDTNTGTGTGTADDQGNTNTGVELPLALVTFTALAAAGVLVFSRKK